MLKNYFRIAWRNLRKNKLYSAINITGLAAGMAIAIVIGLWIADEWQFDKQFTNYRRIAQVYQNVQNNGQERTGTNMPFPVTSVLRKDFSSYIKYAAVSTWDQTHVLAQGEKRLSATGIYCEPDLPAMFTLQMREGSSRLTEPNTILLSESQAKACFGKENPLNKTLLLDNKTAVTVTGVYKDMPANSTFSNVAFMLPWALYARQQELDKNDNPWRSNSYRALVQIAEHTTMQQVSALIKDVKLKNIHADELSFHPQLFLYPMSRWHLYAEFKNGVNVGGFIKYVWLFGISGVFILLLACINFMNLSTARSEKRAKEVGIRKVIGSQRSQLVYQFFSESLLMVMLALVLALLLVQLLLPLFNEVAGKHIAIPLTHPVFWSVCICFSLVTGFIAGSYPAFYLSAFRPVKVLKGTFRVGRYAAAPRKALLVLQFTISVILIIVTIVVFRQIQYAQHRPVGYDRNGLVMLPMYTPAIHNSFDVVRDQLLQSGAIVNMAECWSPVTSVWNTNSGFNWEGKDPGMALDFPSEDVSYDYGKTIGWHFVAGRDFSRSFVTDSTAFVVNEAAVKFMGLKDPVGKIVTWDDEPYHIIGVIKDVIAESPYAPVRPAIYHMLRGGAGTRIIVKLNPGISTQDALAKMETVLKSNNPTHPFDYQFVDQEYARKFGDEQRFGKLASIFSILAIFISCLGLFGMAAFMAEQRTKEIGIRKVLGATLLSLWRLLSTDFVMLVIIALAIAFPVAYYAMVVWLQHYAYHTTIPWWVFPVAGIGTLCITLLTISWQAIRAALMNPVKSLRTE